MIGEKMIMGAGQVVYQIPENDNEDEGDLRGHVTEGSNSGMR
jgi:hypothetical protein